MNAPVPFTAFNFEVSILVDGWKDPLARCAFSECDGLEMNMEIKTIREGGANDRQIRLAGPSVWGQLSLKRGMSPDSVDLWRWMKESVDNPSLRAEVDVLVLGSDRSGPRVRFRLERALPVKLKAPALSARDGLVAVEELQVAYERFSVDFAEEAP